jgi:hypothetical protein
VLCASAIALDRTTITNRNIRRMGDFSTMGTGLSIGNKLSAVELRKF